MLRGQHQQQLFKRSLASELGSLLQHTQRDRSFASKPRDAGARRASGDELVRKADLARLRQVGVEQRQAGAQLAAIVVSLRQRQGNHRRESRPADLERGPQRFGERRDHRSRATSHEVAGRDDAFEKDRHIPAAHSLELLARQDLDRVDPRQPELLAGGEEQRCMQTAAHIRRHPRRTPQQAFRVPLDERQIVGELRQHHLPVQKLVTQLTQLARLTITLRGHLIDARLRASQQGAGPLELPLRQQTPAHGQQQARMPELQAGGNPIRYREDRGLVSGLHELLGVRVEYACRAGGITPLNRMIDRLHEAP